MRKNTCLNGFWDFSPTESLDVLPAAWEKVQIHVPSPFNVNRFARGYPKTIADEQFYVSGGDFRLYPGYPLHWDEAKRGFYKRVLDIPAEAEGKRLFLRFDAVAYRSVYYLNGQKIHEDCEAFLPIEIEITDHVEYGKANELIVGAELAALLKYNEEVRHNRLDYPIGSFWGEQAAGIWQDVFLHERPREYVSDIFAVTDVYKRELKIRYEYVGDAGLTVKFSLQKCGSEAEKEISEAPCDGTEVIWTYNEGEIDLWDFGRPNLYYLKATLCRGGVAVDAHQIRIGFRTFTAEGQKFILNGAPINLKNDSWHYMGFSIQTEAYARAYYKMAVDCNVNIIRLHAQPFPSFFFDIADEMGMLLVTESAVWASHCNFSYNENFFDNCKAHIRRWVQRDRNHPSIVMWSPENECLPAYKVSGSAHIRDLAHLEDRLYELTTEIPPLDESRLISCDGSGDLGGRLPVNSLHYPGYDCHTHREKPITIGEMGSMYYSTPEAVSNELGEKTLESMNGRLTAVGTDAFEKLVGQRKWAAQVCVFNLIWYGLEPMPFADKLLTYDDYTTPGIKPQRITPYLRTLNAGVQADLPEYIPNPVWELTKLAYMPVRFFVENAPVSGWVKEDASLRFTLFNDNRHASNLKLDMRFVNESGKTVPLPVREWDLEACTFIEEALIIKMPETTGGWTLEMELFDDGTRIYDEALAFSVYDRAELKQKFATLNVACVSEDGAFKAGVPTIDCRIPEPYAPFARGGNFKHLYGLNTITFNPRVNGKHFDEYLPFNGKPVYFTGNGSAVIISLMEAGEARILCGIDLNQYKDEPEAWLLKIELGTMLQGAVKTPKPTYLFAAADSNVAAMLDDIRCEYDLITEDQLVDLWNTPQDRLLIIDGSAGDLYGLKGISANNFPKVIVMNLDKTPDLFAHKFKVTTRKAFHLKGGCKAQKLGVYGNALYGLDSGNEEILSPAVLQYNDRDAEEILFGVPNIDWRAWNHNAEFLKTASVLKSEKVDNSMFAGLSRHVYAGSEIYFSQLSLSTQGRKAKHLNARLLSALGARLDLAQSDDLSDLLYAGLYSNHMNAMLYKPLAGTENGLGLRPCLNRIESGAAWTLVKQSKRGYSGAFAIYAFSPENRTDFLKNPDTIDIIVKGEKPFSFYLNDELQASGADFTKTSLAFEPGWNKLVFHTPESQAMPDIRFKRLNNKRIDLKFGIYDNDIIPQNMQKATLFSADQPHHLERAVSGREQHWASSTDQRAGIDFGCQFPTPITAKAIYFNSDTGNKRDFYTPYRFKIFAGDSPEDLKEVFYSLHEGHMYYNEGKVFIRLDDVTARVFKLVLTENALKPLFISDFTVLS